MRLAGIKKLGWRNQPFLLGYQPGGCGKNPGKSNEKDLKYVIKGEMEREVIKRKRNRFLLNRKEMAEMQTKMAYLLWIFEM